MNQARVTLFQVTVKTAITHTVTYFIFGWLAATIFDYARLYAGTSLHLLMRQTTDPWVMAGPLFQPIRGIVFGLVFYLLRESFFWRRDGWLRIWAVLVVLGIFGTFGPTPGSLEGMLYTILPLWVHLRGLPEVLLQSLALSLILFYWVNHPGKKWLDWLMGVLFALFMVFPVLGLLLGGQK